MNGRIARKHYTQWQRPFRDSIMHYTSKAKNCKRWRNRRKAHHMKLVSFFKALKRPSHRIS